MSDTNVDVTQDKMPEALRTKLERLSPFARAYAEFRAKGLKQADAAKRAGSEASSRGSLGRVGYNTEQLDGVKDYILWLEHKRAKACVIEDTEIALGLREVIRDAMRDGKYSEANKALELLGNMIGAFNASKPFKDTNGKLAQTLQDATKDAVKTEVNAFKEEYDSTDREQREKRIITLLEDKK